MDKNTFVKTYFSEATKTQEKYGISAVAILAQAAWESGWGKFAPGNMFFGVKDTDGRNGNEQLLLTYEYSSRPDAKFENIISIKPTVVKGKKMFRYLIKAWFRKYHTPEECFNDHAQFLLRNPRYKYALQFRDIPSRFLKEVAIAGYATDPNYAYNMAIMIKTINKILSQDKG